MTESKQVNIALRDKVVATYLERFGTRPELVMRAPGRINLIGEHTDYNDGFVMPSAVSLGIYFAIGAAEDCHRWYAIDLDEYSEIDDEQIDRKFDSWQDFILGAWLRVRDPDTPKWFQCTFAADLPMGSGLSSSSALTCGVIFGLNTLWSLNYGMLDIANMAHAVERNHVGLKGGMMDQYAIMLSDSASFLLIDCKDLTYRGIHFKDSEEFNIFLLHTNVHRELTTSDYNTRSQECAEALELLKSSMGCDSYRDLTVDDLPGIKHILDATHYLRVKHILTENARVIQAIEFVKSSQWSDLGKTLYDGHDSLKDNFEVSIPQLDFLVNCARNTHWIHGARMMGGGFGGCTINLASKMPEQSFIDQLDQQYYDRFGIHLTFIPINLAGSTEPLNQIT